MPPLGLSIVGLSSSSSESSHRRSKRGSFFERVLQHGLGTLTARVTAWKDSVVAFWENRGYDYRPKRGEVWQRLSKRQMREASFLGLPQVDSASRLKIVEIVKNGFSGRRPRILDAGCGPGITLEALDRAELDFDYLGIDVTPKMVDVAREAHYGRRFEVAEVNDLPYADRSFDISICKSVLEHLQSYQDAIFELVRVSESLVILSFFIQPSDGQEEIRFRRGSFENRYEKGKLVRFLESLERVSRLRIHENIAVGGEEPNAIYEVWLDDRH